MYIYGQGCHRIWFIESATIRGDPCLIQIHLSLDGGGHIASRALCGSHPWPKGLSNITHANRQESALRGLQVGMIHTDQ